MQAGAVLDTYNFNLFESDGSTPFVMTGATVTVAVENPLGAVQTITPTVSSNTVQFQTSASTFPTAGTYHLQIILRFGNGAVSKSRVFPVVILNSIE